MSKRRNQNFIDREVQTSLVIRLCLHWALFLVANAVGVFLWIRLTGDPSATWQETRSAFIGSFFPIALISLALLPVFILDSVRLSNRFTGPIFRLRKTLASLSKGNVELPIEFRENDFWKSLAADFNNVVGLEANTSGKDETRVPNSTRS